MPELIAGFPSYATWHLASGAQTCVRTAVTECSNHYVTRTLPLHSEEAIYWLTRYDNNIISTNEVNYLLRSAQINVAAGTSVLTLQYASVAADNAIPSIACATAGNTPWISWPTTPLAPEQQEALSEYYRQCAIEREKQQAQRRQARIRAIQLLWQHLTKSQKHSLKTHGWLYVHSNCGRRYRLIYALHGNVLRLDAKNNIEQAFCGHMGSDLPIADTLLAQKFLLAHNADKYERAAHPVRHEHASWCRPIKTYQEELQDALSSVATESVMLDNPRKPLSA